MSESAEYMLRWRGRQSGPFAVSDINRMLDNHEIGMGHEIHYQEEWIALEAFFAALKKASAPSAKTVKPMAGPTMPLGPAPIVTTMPGEKVSPLRIKVSLTQPGEAARASASGGAGELRPRSRLLFALLAVLGGFVGAHNFYARQWLTGVLQLLLSVATTLMGFGFIASWVWAMVEAILVRRDGLGVEMR